MVVDNSNKPSWKTREACEAAIAADPKYLGATPSFISDHYAKAYGLEHGGWYLYARYPEPWAVR